MSQSLTIDTQQAASVSLVAAFGLTDIGKHRTTNEDALLVLHEFGLFAVADGMGGEACGEVASKMTIDSVRATFEQRGSRPGARLLLAGIQHANSLVYRAAQDDAAKQRMGTTFAGVLVLENRVVIAHVGDSRVYRLRGGQLDLLTEDHSLVNQYIRDGEWDPAHADSFPYPNAITRAVGSQERVEVEVRVESRVASDVYVICSDGLHGMLQDGAIAAVLRQHADPTRAAASLVEMANDNGGKDNITAVVVHVRGGRA